MIRESWVVEPDGRQDGDIRCWYCKAAVGTEHNKGCVQRNRTAVMKFTVECVVAIPEDWDGGLAEFYYVGSSVCQDRIVDIIEAVTKVNCLCVGGRLAAEFVKEATPDDEELSGIHVEHLNQG